MKMSTASCSLFIVFASLVGCSDAGINANSNVQNIKSANARLPSTIVVAGVSETKNSTVEYCFLQLVGGSSITDTESKNVKEVIPLHRKSLSIEALNQLTDPNLVAAINSSPSSVQSDAIPQIKSDIAEAASKASSTGSNCAGSASSVEVSLGLKSQEEHLSFGWRHAFFIPCMVACYLQYGDLGGYPRPYKPPSWGGGAPILRPF